MQFSLITFRDVLRKVVYICGCKPVSINMKNVNMTKMTITKNQIREKIGKKWWFDDQQVLDAKLEYISGIDILDQILAGKTLKELGAVIRLEKYPKGLLFKTAKGFGFKTFSYPIAKDEIKKVLLFETDEGSGQLILYLTNENNILFNIKKEDIWDVKNYLSDIKFNYETEKAEKPATLKDKKIENTQKHGVPTLISFFAPGVGQLIKGHIMKAVGIWIIGGLFGFFLWWTFIAPFIIWVWNIYDAYNSNSDWSIGEKD